MSINFNQGDGMNLNNGTQRKCRTWIFQADPKRYRIEDSLQSEKQEFWNLNQHAKEVHSGDRVLIWMSGKQAGIYAIGTVLNEPMKMPDSPKGLEYWRSRKEGQRIKPRVLVRYDTILKDKPLLRTYLRCDPSLWNLKILRCAMGTNFIVEEDEWKALEEGWLNDPEVE